MRTFQFNALRSPYWLAGVFSLLMAACGGDGDATLSPDPSIALAPSVTVTAPLASNPAVTGLATNPQIIATFNKTMTASTLNASSFTLDCPASVPISGSVSYDASSRAAIFTPALDLPQNTRCVATVGTGVQDSGGSALPAPFSWAFVTGSGRDVTPPFVDQQTPAQNASAPTNTQVVATFNEDMRPSSLNSTSFTMKTSVTNTRIVGSVSYDVGARTATFTPTIPAPLPANTTFTATIGTAATDLAGNALLAPKVWTFTTADVLDTTAPTVNLVSPVNDGAGVCTNTTVKATFSEPMTAMSLSTDTLTLAPSSSLGTTVPAVVTYDALTQIATIHPSVNLTASTTYTIRVKGANLGVKDLANNAMQADKVWRFSTGTGDCQSTVELGAASNFAILGSAAITNIPTSLITGDVGLTPDAGANITGFSAPLTCPEVVGHIYAVDNTGPACALVDAVLLSNAKTDALAAFAHATGAARGTPTPITTDLEGLTFYPGLYESQTSIDLSAGGILTLDAQGDPNAVFVIRSATAINALSTSQVVLSGGAKASKVFWSAGSAITLGVNSVMKGSLLASTAITLQTGAQLEGRALNQGAAAAAITCDACTITLPSP